jgi:inner membrane protein
VDSITHIALGAVMGEAIAGKSLGKRAMFYGALAQSLPDIDFVAAFWLPASDNILVHRGFTHSFVFGLLATITLAFVANRRHRPLKVPLSTWYFLFGAQILIHLLIDACNAYGVGWFEPFSHQRFSFHILFVADPLFSIWPGIALLVLMYIDSKNKTRPYWILFGLIGCSLYFVYAVSNKLTVTNRAKILLQQHHISYDRLLITPTPMNSWLWFVAAEDKTGFHITHRSVFDNGGDSLALTFFPRQNQLLEPFYSEHDVQQLLRFSQGYYTVHQSADTLIFNDLRFGQIAGWDDPEAAFVFHYYINYPEANLMVIQRGRFSNWNRKTMRSMINRIRSKD